MSKNSELIDLLKEVILLIWNEFLIKYQYCFQAINKLLKDVKSKEQLFEGLTLVIGSDYI